MQNKSILTKTALTAAVICLIVLHACQPKTEYKALPFVDFTAKIDSISQDGLTLTEFRYLRKTHGRFFDLWLYEIIDFEKYGPVSDSLQSIYLNDFLSKNKPVFRAIDKHYKNAVVSKEFSAAIAKLQELMGKIKNPVLYSYFSQFSNYNTFIDTTSGKTIFAYSSEMFMNDTFPLYDMLEVPEFFKRYDHTSQIPSMLVWAYLKSVYDKGEKGKRMIDEAIFNGKIWYTMKLVFEDAKPWDLYGYSEKEWKQMMDDEGQIWRHFLTENVLFQSDFNKYKRYFNYGNHTFGSGIPEDCPPLIGSFSGYRIVSGFMEKQKLLLKEMWKEEDSEKILRISGYNPAK